MLEESRINVDIDILVSNEPPLEVIAKQSKHSALVFLGAGVGVVYTQVRRLRSRS